MTCHFHKWRIFHAISNKHSVLKTNKHQNLHNWMRIFLCVWDLNRLIIWKHQKKKNTEKIATLRKRSWISTKFNTAFTFFSFYLQPISVLGRSTKLHIDWKPKLAIVYYIFLVAHSNFINTHSLLYKSSVVTTGQLTHCVTTWV